MVVGAISKPYTNTAPHREEDLVVSILEQGANLRAWIVVIKDEVSIIQNWNLDCFRTHVESCPGSCTFNFTWKTNEFNE